ncbi:MAG: ADOP family duplicated permease [Acidobacteriota bacterium]
MLEDLAQALRTVARSRGLYLLVAVILAIGIGATVATLTLADAVLLQPLPYPEADRLVTIYEQNLEAQITQMLVSHSSFESLEAMTSLEHVAAYQATNSLTLSGTTEAVRVQSNFVSQHYLSLLDAPLEMGSFFSPEAHSGPMAQRAVVLSWALWQSQFGGKADIVGRTVTLNGEPFEVAGVLAQRFIDLPSAGNPTEVWLPLETYPLLGFDWSLIQQRTTRFLAIVASLADGTELAQAGAEIQTLAETLEADFPASHDGFSMITRSVAEFQSQPFRAGILTLLGGAFFVLLIGCANAANLVLLRATARQSEIAMHLALGAGRRRVARRLTLEGLLTSLLASVLGLGIGYLAIRLLMRFSPVTLPDYVTLQPSPAVIAATLVLAVGTGLLFGAVPGLVISFGNLNSVLRSEGRGASAAGETWRKALIVVEVACAVTLLLGGLQMTQSFRNLAQTPTGFDPKGLLTLRTTLPATEYDTAQKQAASASEVRGELSSIPGVESTIVWSRSMPAQATWYRAFAATGRALTSQSETHGARVHFVSPGGIEELGIPLLQGRGISEADHAEGAPVVVISESTAAAMFPGENPLGRSVHRWNSPASADSEIHYEIVGVVADARLAGRLLTSIPTSDVYYSFDQTPATDVNLLVRTSGNPNALTASVRERMRSLDPALPLYDVQSMSDRLGAETEQSRFAAYLSSTFALISAFLAGLGLYSVLAFFAQTHTREIGLRMALGSQRLGIVSWMSRQTATILALGLTLGLGASAGLSKAMEGNLFGVKAWDPVTISTVLAATAVVAALGSLLPLVRASRVDPAIALKAD